MRAGYEKRFNQGDIVYWCHQERHKYAVHYGMVDEQFSDAVCIDYIVPRERRLIDGIPISEFESEQRYRKLPKGWSYDTKLFEITYEPLTTDEIAFKIDITNPETLKIAYEKGYLVKDSTIFHGQIETEITKDGYRVIRKHPQWQYHITHTSVRPDKVYFTYEEAKKEVEDNIAEFHRQASLSDYNWSVEQIDKTLNLWKGISGSSENEVKHHRDWLLAMDNVEDIEVRLFGGNIQWKYWKNKRWMNIEL